MPPRECAAGPLLPVPNPTDRPRIAYPLPRMGMPNLAGPEPFGAAQRVAAAELLAEAARAGEAELVARGASMGSALPDGARLRVESRRRYRAGDVLVFLNTTGQLVAHRMLGRMPGPGGWRFVMRGDRAPAADGLVPPARVIGRLVGGDADPRLWRVPPRDRVRAWVGFLRYLLSRAGA